MSSISKSSIIKQQTRWQQLRKRSPTRTSTVSTASFTSLATTEVRSPVPNIGRTEDLERIVYSAGEFEDATAAKMNFVSSKFGMSHIRYVRYDGNSFYRAFMYSYMEKVILRGRVAIAKFCDLYLTQMLLPP